MSFWPFKKKETAEKPSSSIISEVDTTITLIPEKLDVRIKTHNISYNGITFQCLSFVTKGLAPLGQKELVLTLEHKNDVPQPYPQLPLDFFKTVYHYASEGSIVEEGGKTEFGNTFLGKKAVIYIIGQDEISGLQTPKEYLSMILLTEKEIEAVNRYGYLRVLSMLGNLYAYYPTPFWNDLSRMELSVGEFIETSILNNFNGLPLSKSIVTQIGEEVQLKIAKGTPMLEEAPPRSMPVAILPSLDASADACYTWNPEQLKVITTYTDITQINKISGCFIGLLAEQETSLVRIIEDGFVILMTNNQWEKFWKAYLNQQPFSIEPSGEGLSFSMEWREEVNEKKEIPYTDFYNPIDQKTYSAQWNLVTPEVPTSSNNRVEAEYLRLITDQGTISENIDTEEMGIYARLIIEEVDKIPNDKIEGSGKFIIQVTLSSTSSPLFEIAAEKKLSAVDEYFKEVHEKVSALDGLKTKKDNVVFQINYVVKKQ